MDRTRLEFVHYAFGSARRFRLVEFAVEIVEFRLKERSRVPDGLIVNRCAKLAEKELDHTLRLKVAQR